MVCENCGKEMIKVGVLNESETQDFYFVNEKMTCANQALNMSVLKELEFSEGQVFEYFRASYDQLAQARYLQFMFDREVKKRLNIDFDKELFIDGINCEVFIHPEE